MILFKAKTSHGFIIKTLFELLYNNIKTGNFHITKEGISFCMMDSNQEILISFFLEADNFEYYKLVSNMNIGVNLIHLNQMSKTIKKKDTVELFIDDKNPLDFGIKVFSKESNRFSTSFVKIQECQTTKIQAPGKYSNPIIINSGEFQKMCKSMIKIGPTIDIKSREQNLSFTNEGNGTMKRCCEFGEFVDNPESAFSDQFKSETLCKMTKLSGLSQNIQVYTKSDTPLLLKAKIGSLGQISIYIKSESLINLEMRQEKARLENILSQEDLDEIEDN